MTDAQQASAGDLAIVQKRKAKVAHIEWAAALGGGSRRKCLTCYNELMNGALRVENYLLAAPAIDLGIALADASAKFADERRRIKEQRQKLDELYRLAEKETSPDQIMGIAAALKNYEETLAAVLVPVIRSAEKVISKRLPRGAPSSQQAFYRLSEEAADIAATWLELYQNTQIRLHLLRSEKLRAQGEAASPTFSNADEAIRYLKGSAGEN